MTRHVVQQPSTAPEWLKRATENLRAKYPGDEFDVVLRKIKPDKPADWRIRCHDCPMMVRSIVIWYFGHPAEDTALGVYHRSWFHALEL